MAAETAALKDVEQEITDEIECVICHEDYVSPKALPCCHVYCLACLEKLVSQARRTNRHCDSIVCPTCRKVAKIPTEAEGGAAGFPTSFHVNKMMEIRAKVQTAQQATVAKDDVTASADKEKSGECGDKFCADTCHLHTSQKVNSFCEDCNLPLCTTCYNSSIHKGHHRRSLASVVHQYKQTIATSLHGPLKKYQDSLELAVSQVDGESDRIQRQAEEVRRRVDLEVKSLQAALEQRRKSVKEEVDHLAHEMVMALKGQRLDLEEAKSQVRDYVSTLQHCLQSDQSRQVIAVGQSVHKDSNEILANRVEVEIPPVAKANLFFLPEESDVQAAARLGHVVQSTVSPSACRASGEGLKDVTIGDKPLITVETFNRDGKPCEDSIQLVTLEVVSLADGTKQLGKLASAPCQHALTYHVVGDRGKVSNQHALTYHVVTKGKHQLHIKVNGGNIHGSPFTVMAYPRLQFRGTYVRSITNLYRPWGLAVDESARLVVIDNRGWQGVHVFETHDGSKALESFLDSASWSPLKPVTGVVEGQCNKPRGVAIDGDGNILVVDGKVHRIQQFTSSGSFLRSAGSYGNGLLQFNDPVGIAVHPHTNEVYVCDRRNNRIQVLSENLSYIRSFGTVGSGPTCLQLPWDVGFDSCGNIYVADCGNCCIKVYSPQWHYLRSIGRQGTQNGEFQHVSSICIDKDDFVYATDKEKNRVSIFHPRGEFVMQFGHPGKKEGEMYYPLGVAVDEDGFVYVSDSYNQRVQVFQ